MKAYKCDICGAYYDSQPVEGNTWEYYIQRARNHLSPERLDLCPVHHKRLQEFARGKNTTYNEDQEV